MRHTTLACLRFSFTDLVRFFAGFFYRAYFYFSGDKRENRLNRLEAC